MKEFGRFCEYIVKHKFNEFSTLYLNAVREQEFSVAMSLSEEARERLYSRAALNFKKLLKHIAAGSGFEFVDENIASWRNDKYEEVKKEELTLHDLILALSIRKKSLIRFLPHFVKDLDDAIRVMEQISTFFDHLREKVYQAFHEIQSERLAEEKEFAETILDTTVEGITGIDKEMRIVISVETRTGVRKEKILGKAFADFFPENAQGFELDMIKRAQAGERLHFEEIPLKSRDGYYDIDIVPMKRRNGEITGSLSFSRDVTERVKNLNELRSANKKLEEQQKELNRSNEQLQEKLAELEEARAALERQSRFIENILDASPDFITVFNLKERKNVFANRKVGEYLGYKDIEGPREEGIDFLKKVIHPEDMPAAMKFFAAFSAEKKSQVIEYRIKDATGAYRWIRGSYNTLHEDSRGVPVEIVGLSRDITDEKLRQQRIQQALEHYLNMLEDFPALIWRAGIDGKSDYFNKTWLKFTGKPLEEQLGDGWLNNVHPEDVAMCRSTFQNSFNERKHYEAEYRLRRHDGVYRWIVDFGKPIYGLEGEFMGFLGACFDIQERKDYEGKLNETNQELAAALEELQSTEEQLIEANSALEEKVNERTAELEKSRKRLKINLESTLKLNTELAERENFLASIIDQTPVSTWISDSRGVQVRYNQAYVELFHVSDPEKDTGAYNILQDKNLKSQPFYPDIKSVYENGAMANFTLEYRLKQENRIIFLNVSMFPVKGGNGELLNVVVKHEDITQRKKAEAALREREEQLRLITDSVPALISYIDKDLRFRFVNNGYTRWFNRTRDGMLGRRIPEILGEENFENIKPYVKKALEGVEVKYETIISSHDSNGAPRYVQANYVPNKVDGKVEGFYALISDVSQLKAAQEALLEKNRELVRINSDLDNFVYTASHDLKAPIVNLEGLLLALGRSFKDNLSEKEQKLIGMMNESLVKLKETIDYLDDVTSIAKNFEEKAERLSIPEIVNNVKTDVKELISKSNAELIEEYEEKEIYFVKGNLNSIFYNLISNALKYRSPKRPLQVRIRTFRDNGYFVLEVADNGLGLNEKQQSKLFTMFKRLHKHVDGSGIGLYILKRIIENVNGKIEVESYEDKGSTFKVLIPIG